ncbi:hypothetical protein ACFP1Z_30675 [Streptomyces gamaensis]|uniref:Transposase IS4-like domain-containing protein n=1 Tax=Streptomyces gamaensis TaxID=1763542 RepID=A0ABW0Z996_9ACTN
MDGLGPVLAVLATAASVQNRDAAVPLPEQLRARYVSVRLVRADCGYAGGRRLPAQCGGDLMDPQPVGHVRPGRRTAPSLNSRAFSYSCRST